MCCKGVLRRIVPFFLTFAVGLFIASFFVSIAAPTFRFDGGWRRHQQYHRMMEFENQRLNEENSRLKRQLADRDDSSDQDFDLKYTVPPPPPMPPAPPVRVQTIPYRVK